MITVRRLIFILSDIRSSCGILDTAKLARKLAITTPPTILSVLAAGMMMAINIPYSATLKALTIDAGRMLPATIPKAVPSDQPGRAIAIAP